jgi:hypothetical protein
MPVCGRRQWARPDMCGQRRVGERESRVGLGAAEAADGTGTHPKIGAGLVPLERAHPLDVDAMKPVPE